MRLRRFNPKAEYIPGKKLAVADMLSRNPLVTTGDESTVEPVSTYVDSIDTFRPISDIRVEQLKIATQNDTTLQDVIKYTIQGWPSFTNTPQNIRIYANEQNHALILLQDTTTL